MDDQQVKRSTRGPRVPGLLVLAMVGAAVWFVLRNRDVESLIPIVRESRIDLVARLDSAQQVSGFPPHVRWLEPHVFPEVNIDDAAIPILMPATGVIAFPEIPIHSDATLEFQYGIEAVAPADPASGQPSTIGEGVAIVFELRIGEQPTNARTLFQDSVQAGKIGDPPKRQRASVAIPEEFRGRSVTLYFSCAAQQPIPELVVLPAYSSPVLRSTGVKVRMSEQRIATTTLVADLLAEFAPSGDGGVANAFYGTKRQIDAEGVVQQPEEVRAIRAARVPSFDAARKFEAERWGAWPAIAFGTTGPVARYSLDIPEGEVRLECEIGLDRRSIGVGSASFFVDVDGKNVFSRTLDPTAEITSAGWHEVSVSLSEFAGKRVELTLRGEVQARAKRSLRESARDAFDREVITEWEIRGVQAAFAHPRVMRHDEAARRLAAKKDPARPSVIFVNIETLRADVLGCYGGKGDISPAIDRLAAEGVRVAPCISVAPWTAPSVASTLTGLYPYSHGVISYAQSYLPATVETLAERASRAGVTTVAFVTNDLISRRSGFDQGFEQFHSLTYANANQVVGAFDHWLADHGDLQFFAYLHLFEPHDPCNAPGEDRERYVPERLRGQDDRAALARLKRAIAENRAFDMKGDDLEILRGRYLGEVRYVDRQIERLRHLIESRGLLGRVVLVITSDHGEEFGEHGLIGHGSHCFEESVAVPLVIYGPGQVPAGVTIDGPVQNHAMFATTLDLLGVPYDPRAVEPALRFDGSRGYGSAYSSTEQGLRSVSLSGIRTKTIHRLRTSSQSYQYSPPGAPELEERSECAGFDLAKDPAEQRNAIGAADFDVAALRKALKSAWEFAHSQSHGIATDHVDAATEDAMKQLGYLSGVRSNAAGALFGKEDDCGTKR